MKHKIVRFIPIRPSSAKEVIGREKVIAIIPEYRSLKLGYQELYDPVDDVIIPVNVIRISYCQLQHMSLSDIVLHGEKTYEEIIQYFDKNYNVKILADDIVTVIRFDFSG